jgi:hypothetical protein
LALVVLPEAAEVKPGLLDDDEGALRGLGVRTTKGEPAGDGELLELDPKFLRSEGIRSIKSGRGARFVFDLPGGADRTIGWVSRGGEGGEGERVRGYEMLSDFTGGEVIDPVVDAELEEVAVNLERNE